MLHYFKYNNQLYYKNLVLLTDFSSRNSNLFSFCNTPDVARILFSRFLEDRYKRIRLYKIMYNDFSIAIRFRTKFTSVGVFDVGTQDTRIY
jgi:hypothetical protein